MSDGEYPEFFSENFHRARKPYKCCECKRMIPCGCKYLRSNGKWDGEVDSWPTCEECAMVRSFLLSQSRGHGSSFGSLREDVMHREYYDYLTGDLRPPGNTEVEDKEEFLQYCRIVSAASACTVFATLLPTRKGHAGVKLELCCPMPLGNNNNYQPTYSLVSVSQARTVLSPVGIKHVWRNIHSRINGNQLYLECWLRGPLTSDDVEFWTTAQVPVEEFFDTRGIRL